MARKYGKNATTRNNVLKLVEALLALADEEISVPGDKLKATFYLEWIKEDELLVSGKVQQKRNNRTQVVEKGITKEDLWVLVECLGEVLELSQPKDEKNVDRTQQKANVIQDILDCLKDLDILELKPSTKNQGFWKFHLKLRHHTAGRKNLEVIREKWQDKIGSIAPEASHEVVVFKNKSPDWRGICGQMLAEQKKLTTYSHTPEVSLPREEIYVPLAIVERKPPKPQPRNPQEEKEEEKLIPIAEESFFEEVLRSGRSEISQGRKIAVIGEPGSGKTTRLQKIADWILEQGLGLPIWIDLADPDLENQNICQYLESIWLPKCKGEIKRCDLEPQIGQAWLLLDGVDEMSRTQRMEQLAKDLSSSWIQSARVVVSCRVNVWEADKNAFSGFDVFRNLEFSPEQVRDYIRCWFAGAGDVATGEDLDRALTQSENYRLKELIQNPLQLWMLCHIWYQNRGGLPETQAELYGQFVDRVYDWKADEEILDQREAIDAALAKLALAAMEQQDEVSRFRLRESWVVKKLGSRQIFKAIEKLGWLNRVERSPEAICVFYHATFQEYFAALGVENWDYFLPRDHENSPVVGKKYRIFEPQWKQVILLWLGREDIADEQKEEFINKLVSFDTGCHENGNFYYYRAFFLAAAGINEFKTCSLAAEIVRQVVKWGFGYFNKEKQEWQTFLDPIKEGARQAIPETIRQLAITEITNILEYCPPDFTRRNAAESLGEIGQGNPQAITTLIRILETTEDKGTFMQAAESLGVIDQGNPRAIVGSIRILETGEDNGTLSRAAEILGKIGQGNPHAITELIRILETTEDKGTFMQAAEILGVIDQGNPRAIVELIRILETTEDESTRRQAAFSLHKIGQGNPHVITELIRILETTEDESTRRFAIVSLHKVGQGNPHVITELIRILETTEDESTRRLAAYKLAEIDRGNPHAIVELIRTLETTEDEDTRCRAADSLGEIDRGNPHAIVELIRILETTEDKSTQWRAAFSLKSIAQGNLQVIAELIRILKTTEDEDIRWRAADSLGEIDRGNPHAIVELIRILETTENENIRGQVVDSLGEIAQGNPHAITTLIRILETTKDEDILCRTAFSLGQIDKGNPKAIAELIRILETTEDEYTRAFVANDLVEIGQGNPHAITTLIRILKTTEDEEILCLAAFSLQEILTTPEQYAGVVSTLKEYLSDEVYQNNFDRFNECYKVLWHCAANLPYPDFYHAWHSPPE